MVRRMTLAGLMLLLASGCASDDGSARTYYESLDLSTPMASAETFVEAFDARDFMTLYLVLDARAAFRIQQSWSLLDFEGLIRAGDVPELEEEIRTVFDLDTMEHNDAWYIFDRLMLMAELPELFPGQVRWTDVGDKGVRRIVLEPNHRLMEGAHFLDLHRPGRQAANQRG